jgi:threonine/homoserine/homoserine lactone efflux protein
MLNATQALGFTLAAMLITLAPGPDNLMVLSVGMSQGRRYGVAFGLGCALGCLSHTLLACIGVSALIAASPLAFQLLKLGGGLYLLWLGFHALRSQGVSGSVSAADTATRSPMALFYRGIVANAINPKVILFFLSFLPQFVVASDGHTTVQVGLLGLIFTLQAAILFALIGALSGAIGQALKRRPRAAVWLDRLAGTVFVGLGVKLIVSR